MDCVRRMRRTVQRPKRKKLGFVERFWARVNRDGPIPAHQPDSGPCWLWMGARMSKERGYGVVSMNNKVVRASRVSWFLTSGSWPTLDRHPTSKLTTESVRVIRARVLAGDSGSAIAKELHLAQSTVARAVNGRTWAHVT